METTIQETSKKLKLQALISSIIFWAGITWFFISMNSGGASLTASLLIAIGIIWYVLVKVMIWWHHK